MDFNFTTDFLKAEETENGLFITGVASTSAPDKQNEVMSASALKSMVETKGIIPLTKSHNAEIDDIIGEVSAHEIDAEGRYVIKAELDRNNPEAVKIFNSIKRGHKAGFSVGGKILEVAPSFNKSVKRIINKVELDHIMVTRRPVQGETFASVMHKALDSFDDKETNMNLDEILKNEDVQKHINEEVAKAGASLSADNKSKLKAIHDAGNDDVKSMVRSMLGMDADDILGIAVGSASTEADPIGVADDAGNYEDPNAVAKSAITLEALEEFKKSIITEFKSELAKSAPKSDATLEKSEPVSDETLADMLSKGLFKKK